jgi:hypothetical protein
MLLNIVYWFMFITIGLYFLQGFVRSLAELVIFYRHYKGYDDTEFAAMGLSGKALFYLWIKLLILFLVIVIMISLIYLMIFSTLDIQTVFQYMSKLLP